MWNNITANRAILFTLQFFPAKKITKPTSYHVTRFFHRSPFDSMKYDFSFLFCLVFLSRDNSAGKCHFLMRCKKILSPSFPKGQCTGIWNGNNYNTNSGIDSCMRFNVYDGVGLKSRKRPLAISGWLLQIRTSSKCRIFNWQRGKIKEVSEKLSWQVSQWKNKVWQETCNVVNDTFFALRLF